VSISLHGISLEKRPVLVMTSSIKISHYYEVTAVNVRDINIVNLHKPVKKSSVWSLSFNT